jgi:hypothetical protein
MEKIDSDQRSLRKSVILLGTVITTQSLGEWQQRSIIELKPIDGDVNAGSVA